MTKPSSQVHQPSAKRQRSDAIVEIISRKQRQLFPSLSDDESDGSLVSIMRGDPMNDKVVKWAEEEEAELRKAVGEEAPTKQGVTTGIRQRPFNFRGVTEFKVHNPHHSTCIDAKRISTVGLGHVAQATHDTLDPLTRIAWQQTLLQAAEDFENTGNGYLEVIRDTPTKNGKIIGLHWMPSVDVWIHIENQRYDQHFEVFDRGSVPPFGRGRTIGRRFARFGDLEQYLDRFEVEGENRSDVSELIHIAEPSSLSRFYGVPGWLAAIAYVELAQAMVQHQFDFHINRGVPEFMLFILGAKLQKKDWEKVTGSLKSQIGLGNSHKTIALNLPNSDMKIQIEKLAIEAAQDGEFFSKMMETLAMSIVSAHRVPPSLAGILIAGKMGAANEISNAIMAFQALVIGPKQNTWETVLGCTLGNPLFNGELGLDKESFTLKTVLDEVAEAMEKLKPLNVMGRMRAELPDAVAEGRDLEDGLEKGVWTPAAVDAFINRFVRGLAFTNGT